MTTSSWQHVLNKKRKVIHNIVSLHFVGDYRTNIKMFTEMLILRNTVLFFSLWKRTMTGGLIL